MKFEIFSIALSLMIVSSNAVDYCKENGSSKCFGYNHVGCPETNPIANGGWGPTCADGEVIEMTPDVQEAIVEMYNKLRNQIAMGQLEHYDPASRMATVRWDPELSTLAEINARNCKQEHSKCQITEKHPKVGQSITKNTVDIGSTENDWPKRLANMAKGFFDENAHGKYWGWMKTMKNYLAVPSTQETQIGHFQQFVRQAQDAIGCAATKFTDKDNEKPLQTILLSCNAGDGMPQQMESVYDIGPTASQCKTGPNAQYPGLCSKDETYEAVSTDPEGIDFDDISAFLPPGAVIYS